MKSPLLLVCLCLQLLAFGQITFEEVTSPDDFNISEIRKSPLGEYFVQAANDIESIYTSMNGEDWTKSPLPENHVLTEVQFFSDGTPVLKAERNEHIIRRNGVWYTMNISLGGDPIEASFIKEDTLFAYKDNIFAYSLDKGQSFTTVFTYIENIADHNVNLWKFNNHFVLHHAGGASDYLSIFNENGDQVLSEYMNLGIPSFIYNNCGEVFCYDSDTYYLIKEQGLSFETGNISDIFPFFSYGNDFISQAGNYYIREDDIIYKSNGCDFTWEALVSHDLIESKAKFWINHQEDIFLYDSYSDRFIEELSGAKFVGRETFKY